MHDFHGLLLIATIVIGIRFYAGLSASVVTFVFSGFLARVPTIFTAVLSIPQNNNASSKCSSTHPALTDVAHKEGSMAKQERITARRSPQDPPQSLTRVALALPGGRLHTSWGLGLPQSTGPSPLSSKVLPSAPRNDRQGAFNGLDKFREPDLNEAGTAETTLGFVDEQPVAENKP